MTRGHRPRRARHPVTLHRVPPAGVTIVRPVEFLPHVRQTARRMIAALRRKRCVTCDRKIRTPLLPPDEDERCERCDDDHDDPDDNDLHHPIFWSEP